MRIVVVGSVAEGQDGRLAIERRSVRRIWDLEEATTPFVPSFPNALSACQIPNCRSSH
jgi:hypothetical protein